MELILVRHGEPDLSNDDDAWMADPPLTELGHRQAEATASFLADTHIDAVYISPQQRAQQTSVPLLRSRAVESITDERIAEFDYELGRYVQPSMFEGMTRDEAMNKLSELQGPPFQGRVRAGFAHIVEANPGRTIAAVCHGGVINAVIRDVLQSTQPLAPQHASVTRIVASRTGVRTLLSFNEHHWLKSLA